MASIIGVNAENLADPANYLIGFDLRTENASVVLFVNDVPPMGVFEDEAELGGQSVMKTQFNMNSVFLPDKNTVRLRFRFLDFPEDSATPDFRFRFYYWDVSEQIEPFENAKNGFAIEGHFFLEKNDEGQEIIKYTEVQPGQKYLMASKLKVAGVMHTNEWIDVEFDVKSNFSFAPRAWIKGQTIQDNKETRQAIVDQFETLNNYFQNNDKGALYKLYEPMMKNQGLAYGSTAEEWFDYQIAEPYLDGKVSFEKFDASKSNLRIYGNGKLATLDHLPIRYSSEGSEGTVNPFYYLDSDGNWKMMD